MLTGRVGLGTGERFGTDHPFTFAKRDKPSIDGSPQQYQLCHGILVAPDHGILFMLARQYPGGFERKIHDQEARLTRPLALAVETDAVNNLQAATG